MQKIVRLTRKHIDQLAQIDVESKHQMEPNYKLAYYKALLVKRFKSDHETFFGLDECSECNRYFCSWRI